MYPACEFYRIEKLALQYNLKDIQETIHKVLLDSAHALKYVDLKDFTPETVVEMIEHTNFVSHFSFFESLAEYGARKKCKEVLNRLQKVQPGSYYLDKLEYSERKESIYIKLFLDLN